MVRCKNCGDTIAKKYCPNCGQAIEQKLTFRRALEDTMRGITNGDSGVLFTVKELCIRPGKMIDEYLDGRRIVHFRPFPLLILLTGFITIIDDWASTVNIENQQTIDEIKKLVPATTDNGIDWYDATPIKALCFIPAFALASWMLFRSKKYNFVEHAYITAFATIQRQMIFFIFMTIPSLIFLTSEPPEWLQTSSMLSIGAAVLGYTYWDYKQIFKLSVWSTIWRVIVIFSIGCVLILLTFSFAIIMTVIADWAAKFFDKLFL